MRIGVIADDLTGALDTGVQFRNWGLSVQVVPILEEVDIVEEKNDVIVINTDSRYDIPKISYNKVKKATEILLDHVQYFYKKIDSTIRGNIGKELDALMDITNQVHAIMAPAFPQAKRSTINGDMYVDGVPLSQTEYSTEISQGSSHIPNIIALQSQRKIAHISLENLRKGHTELVKAYNEEIKKGNQIIIFDAKTEHDLLQVGKLCKQTSIICGSAGLAAELPEALGIRSPPPSLTVCGSTRATTKRQVIQLADRLGTLKINLNTLDLITGLDAMHSVISQTGDAIADGNHVVIVSAPDTEIVKKTRKLGEKLGKNAAQIDEEVVDALATVTVEVLKDQKVSGIILTGGATALAVLEKIGAKTLKIIEEVQPGIPLIELSNGVKVVTKAGGFGLDDALVEASQFLRRKYR